MIALPVSTWADAFSFLTLGISRVERCVVWMWLPHLHGLVTVTVAMSTTKSKECSSKHVIKLI